MITPDFEVWNHVETFGDLRLALPKEPEQPEPESPSDADATLAGQVWVADEFGDCFGVLDGDAAQLSARFAAELGSALGFALDQLYGVEWGTAEVPAIDPSRGEAELVGFGQAYLGTWREHAPGLWLFAIARPEREALARAFVVGGSIR